jgi:hypothetical protein
LRAWSGRVGLGAAISGSTSCPEGPIFPTLVVRWLL